MRKNALPRHLRKRLAGEPLAHPLSCGCVLYPNERFPSFPCREAVALGAATRLGGAIAAAAPGDAFFARIAAITRAALAQHLGEIVEGAPVLPLPAGEDQAA